METYFEYSYSGFDITTFDAHTIPFAPLPDTRDLTSIYALSLSYAAGLFSKSNSLLAYPNVSVQLTSGTMVLACSCYGASQGLCVHQAEVWYALLQVPMFRIFFDAKVRRDYLLPYAKDYGICNEPNLDAYFLLQYSANSVAVKMQVKELVKVTKDSIPDVVLNANPLLPPTLAAASLHNKGTELPKPPKPAKPAKSTKSLKPHKVVKQTILVFARHKYYSHLTAQLMEAEVGKDYKLKGTPAAYDPIGLLPYTSDADSIKFYAACIAMQHRFSEDLSAQDIATLKLIVKNPLALPIYFHDKNMSENKIAKALRYTTVHCAALTLKLTVVQKDTFFEVTGSILINDIQVPLRNVLLRYDSFIAYAGNYYLIDNILLLQALQYLKKHDYMLIVHASKYAEFEESFLNPLAHFIHIDYAYIHKAAEVYPIAQNGAVVKNIYLQQEGNYITILPVVQYGATEVPVYSKKQVFDYDPFGNRFLVHRDTVLEEQLTALVMLQHPDFEEQLQEFRYFYLHHDRFFDDNWFLEAFEVWRNAGIEILGYDTLDQNKWNPYKPTVDIQVRSGTDWFRVHLQVKFGDTMVRLKQLHSAIRYKRNFVLLDDGSQGLLPDVWMAKIAQYFRIASLQEDFLTIPKVNFSEVVTLFDKELLSKEVSHEIALLQANFLRKKDIPAVAAPEALQATLRDYQQAGLNWLSYLDDLNFGGCLADDMGLGKTLQVIALLLLQQEKRGKQTSLVVVPTSLLFNWQDEVQRFAPSLQVLLYYGNGRKEVGMETFNAYDIVLTSYGTLLSDIRLLKSFNFNYIILDEAQAIKNPNSERYKAARLLQARNRLVLTGTPIENHLLDIFGQLSFACPGLLGNKQFFKDTYITPVEQFNYGPRAVELQQRIQPFVLRRTKREVARELPQKTEMVLYCVMNAVQRQVYDTYEKELRDFINKVPDLDVAENRLHVLAGLTRLRQICNSPFLLKDGYSATDSVKIDVLLQQIEEKASVHKILVFSQFVGMLDLIADRLKLLNIPFAYLHGQSKDRKSIVQDFKDNAKTRVFLISLKAGGVGLNLPEADYVFLVDPWWNPAVENQAIDRSHRIGQDKNVVVVRLICTDTVEEKIMLLQQKKTLLAQDVILSEVIKVL
ncbi:DEAD/DEAH box helicase [Sphingobacterium sp. Mn56C]|uniref:DEAD/DEAH box helicase n=1 Tax=Sphingobacterium sp. Mn56C TaxID=3395261 RepID=UPI003BD61A74